MINLKLVQNMTKNQVISKYYTNIEFKYGVERWKEIPGHPRYEVSNYTRVRRILSNGKKVLVKPTIGSAWYFSLALDGEKHNIVYWSMITWCKKPKTKNQVHHLDENYYNNHISNMKWVSAEEHAKIHHLGSKPKTKRAVLMYNKSGELIKRFPSYSEAGYILGVHPTNILRYCTDRMVNEHYDLRWEN